MRDEPRQEPSAGRPRPQSLFIPHPSSLILPKRRVSMTTVLSSAAPAAPSEGFVEPFRSEPIRAEVYGQERLEVHARELAAASAAAVTGLSRPLLQRLRDNGGALRDAYREVAAAARRQETLTPDAEWLLDNFYLLEDVLRAVRHDLPRGYYAELPRLTAGCLAGFPRVFALALGFIAHTDSILSEDLLLHYVRAYQSVGPLTIGELWAVPTMLRLGLLENLRRLADRMLAGWAERAGAEIWIEPLRTAAARTGGESGQLLPPLSPLPRTSDTLIVRALQIVRDTGPPAAFEFLKHDLAGRGINVAEVVRREN